MGLLQPHGRHRRGDGRALTDVSRFKTLDDLPEDLTGKKVLVRVDLNVPMDGARVTDDTRLRAMLPTVLELADRGAIVLLLSHFGRPKGEKRPDMLEKVAERYHTTPATIVALNGPDKLIGPGQILKLPNVVPQSTDYSGANDKQSQLLTMLNVEGNAPKADYIVVDKSDGTLKVYRGSPPAKGEKPSGQLVAQFPVTTGSGHDPLPLGTWKTTTYSFLPPFNFQPDLFWDVSDDKAEQKLPPGPNGPVGVAWLDLTKEHYGIHGTSEPQTIQKTESHGCLRLTNWDVMRLSLMLKPGFTAVFVA